MGYLFDNNLKLSWYEYPMIIVLRFSTVTVTVTVTHYLF
jgi:hypothetical protein